MKAIKFLAAIAVAAMLASSCSLLSKGGSSAPAAGSTSTVATAPAQGTTAQQAGSAAGSALRTLYAAYAANGNKLDMSNPANLLNIASLTSSIAGLKAADKDYKKGFATGLVLGSSNLVTNNTSNTVMDQLSKIAGTVVNSNQAQQAANTASSVAKDAGAIASSVSNILSIFKK